MRRFVWTLMLVSLGIPACGRSDLPLDDVSPEHKDASSSEPEASAPSECSPPVLGAPPGPCTLCNGVYYCPGMGPLPQCRPGQTYVVNEACETACIACPGDGTPVPDPRFANDAWLWDCTLNIDGAIAPPGYSGVFDPVVSYGDPCP